MQKKATKMTERLEKLSFSKRLEELISLFYQKKKIQKLLNCNA